MEYPTEPASGPSAAGREGPPPSGESIVRLGLIFYGLFMLAAVVWRVGFYRESLLYASPAAAAVGLSPVRDVLLGLAVGGVLLGLSDWLTRSTAWGDQLARELGKALAPLSLPNALLLAFASGLAEEMFFRGALQPRAGWFVASLLFGCAHFVPRKELLPWTGFAVFAGFLFAGLFAWTGNLVAPVCAHVLVNAVNLPLLARRYGAGAPDATPEPKSTLEPPES